MLSHYIPRRSSRLPPADSIPGLPLDADPPNRRRPIKPFTAALGTILQRYNIRLAATPQSLLEDWPALAGAELAGRVRPGKFENNILYLYTATSADLFEIRRFKLRQLEARIKQDPRYKSVRQVRLQLDPEG